MCIAKTIKVAATSNSSKSSSTAPFVQLGGRYLTVEERALLYQVDCDVTSFVSKKAKLTSISDTRLCETAESNKLVNWLTIFLTTY